MKAKSIGLMCEKNLTQEQKTTVKKKYLTPIFFYGNLTQVIKNGRENRTGISL